VVEVVLLGVSVRRLVPVLTRRQRLGKDTHVTQRERHTLSERGVAGGGRVADQRDAVSVWVVHERVGALERRERPRRLRLGDLLREAELLRVLLEAADVG